MEGMIATALAWAAQEATNTGAAQQATDKPDMSPMLMMIAVIGLMFYFLILRPKRAEDREREKMMNELGKGDQVVTAGGIHGTVEGVDKSNGTVTVNVAPKLTLTFNRTSIFTVKNKKNKPKSDNAKADEGKTEEKAGH